MTSETVGLEAGGTALMTVDPTLTAAAIAGILFKMAATQFMIGFKQRRTFLAI
jgi:hypothetical protein